MVCAAASLAMVAPGAANANMVTGEDQCQTAQVGKTMHAHPEIHVQQSDRYLQRGKTKGMQCKRAYLRAPRQLFEIYFLVLDLQRGYFYKLVSMTAWSSFVYHNRATDCHGYAWLTSDQSDVNL